MIGHKGALWLRVVCRGVTAHGSTPGLGVNAVYTACRAVGKIEDFGFNVQPHAVLGGPSLNVGRMRGGININSAPDKAEFDIDIRTIPSQDHADIRDHVERVFEGEAAVETTVDVGGVPEVETAKYFTDASVLTPAYGDPPTLVLGPGDAALAHVTDEYCEIEKLYQAVEIYEMIINRWCGLD